MEAGSRQRFLLKDRRSPGSLVCVMSEPARTARVERVTKETSITVAVDLDGSGRWSFESEVLKARRKLARYGFVIITLSLDRETGTVEGDPEILTQGFADIAETPALIEGTRRVVTETLDQLNGALTEVNLKSSVKSALKKYYQQETKRRPIILPIVVEG